MIFVMTGAKTKVIVTSDKWLNDWIRFLMVRCQNGDKQQGVSSIQIEYLRSGCEVKKWKTLSSKEENWQETAEELHKPIKRNFTRRRVIVYHIDEIWCSDLVEMQQFSKWNKGYRYLLMVLDVFSKYGRIVPLKDKKK